MELYCIVFILCRARILLFKKRKKRATSLRLLFAYVYISLLGILISSSGFPVHSTYINICLYLHLEISLVLTDNNTEINSGHNIVLLCSKGKSVTNVVGHSFVSYCHFCIRIATCMCEVTIKCI